MRHDSKVIKTAAVDSQDAAYSLAFQKLNQLKSEPASELSADLSLPVGSDKEKNSVALDDGAFITVQEAMNKQGKMVYQGLVNVTYSYSQAN
jgi:hypothetical protein